MAEALKTTHTNSRRAPESTSCGLLDTRRAASFLGLPTSTLRHLARERRLAYHRVGRRMQFTMTDLRKLLESGYTPTLPASPCYTTHARNHRREGGDTSMPRTGEARGLWLRGDTWWVDYVDSDGRRVRESARTTDRREAQAHLERRRVQARDHALPPRGGCTLAEFWARWAPTKAHLRSWRSHAALIAGTVERLGHLSLERLTPAVVEGYRAERIAKGRAPATVNAEVMWLRALVRAAAEWGCASDRTLVALSRIRPLRQAQRDRYLTAEQCTAVVGAVHEHIRPIVALAMNTGMRIGEILALRWEHVDLRNGRLTVEDGKTGSRVVVLNAQAVKVLSSLPRPIKGGQVWTITAQGVRHHWRRACHGLGLDGCHVHDLRHTHATHLALAGAHPQVIQAALGHRTPAMSLRYTHLGTEEHVRAVRRLSLGSNVTASSQKARRACGK